MGAPAGHPYAHPEGVCINGLGALPSPYGPTLRGAHYRSPMGSSKKKKRGVHVPASTQPSIGRDNLGQKLWAALVNVRLCAPSPNPNPLPH